MPILKCKMCGGDLDVLEDSSVCQCVYCGTSQTVPKLDHEKKVRMFERADALRRVCEFDEASRAYEGIVVDFPEEAEAYWGLVLCRYGIEYVDDPLTRRKIPTCHRTAFESITADADYQRALQWSDAMARRVYEKEAHAIEDMRAKIVQQASMDSPYDVFICYKETDGLGDRTEDSVLAQEVYEELTKAGLRVFFARISLEDKLGSEYEPIIFSALSSARVMLVFGTKPKYFSEVWVKNEWMRFLKLIERGERKTIIPCYKYIDPGELPEKLARLQAQDLGKLGCVQDLTRGVMKIVGKVPEGDVPDGNSARSESAFMKRGRLALEDGDFAMAASFFESALNVDPEDGGAYLGKFLSKQKVPSLGSLREKIVSYDEDRDFQKALRFSGGSLKKELESALAANQSNIDELNKARETSQGRCREAFSQLLGQGREGGEPAEDCVIEFTDEDARRCGCATAREAAGVMASFASALSGRSLLSRQDLLARVDNDRGDSAPAKKILGVLVDGGLVEQVSEGSRLLYGLPGIKAERDARASAEHEYQKACEEVQRRREEELAPLVQEIRDRYAPEIKGIEEELGALEATRLQDEVRMRMQLSQIQRKKASLGLFDRAQRKLVDEQISSMSDQIAALPSLEALREPFLARLNAVALQRECDIRAARLEVYARHPLPQAVDYAGDLRANGAV